MLVHEILAKVPSTVFFAFMRFAKDHGIDYEDKGVTVGERKHD